MANAIPGDRRISERAAPRAAEVAVGAPMEVAPQAAEARNNGRPSRTQMSSHAVGGATWTGGGAVSVTTGKVFFSMGGGNYVCSGSSVPSSHGNLVLTAGHCLHQGPGSWASNWAFVPAYSGNGSTQTGPYGVWAATNLWTTSQWAYYGDFNYDVGFAIVAPPAGQGGTLASTVGTQGIGFNQPTGAHVHAFGYPAGWPYGGATLTYCAGNATPDPYGNSTQGVVCNMTGGSSGGPWYRNFNSGSGTGTAYSVNSYGYTSGPHSNKMFGPYFGSAIHSLWQAAR